MNSPLLTQVLMFYLAASLAKLSSYANGSENKVFTNYGVDMLNRAVDWSLIVLLLVEICITFSHK